MTKNLFPQNQMVATEFDLKSIYQTVLKSVFTVMLLFLSVAGWGQTTIASEGFNNSSTLFTLSGGAYYTGNSVAGDRPASSPLSVEGTHSYGLNASSTATATATLTSSNINTSSYSGVNLTFRLAAFSIGSTTNGLDGTDIIDSSEMQAKELLQLQQTTASG